MLKIDITVLISFLLSVLTIFLLGLWLFQNKKRERKDAIFNDINYLQQCPYCTHIFSLYKKEKVYQCPECKSYIGEN